MIKFIKKFLNVPIEKSEGDVDSYIKKLESGYFKDKVCYGISDETKGFLVSNPLISPGALYCGGMGSGKSIAMRFTAITHFISNSENTFYILVDPVKGMTDYIPLFKYRSNVAVALNDTAKLIPVIEMVSAEMHARKEEFSKIGANNIEKYDEIMRKKNANDPGMARIVLCIEEFHSVPNAEQIKYAYNSEKNGSAAFLLKEILRIGRSYGISLLAASQRATADDFPSSLKPGISQIMVFKVSNPTDASALNLSHASEIRGDQKGRCAYEGGFIQYPYIDDSSAEYLLEKYSKPLTARLLKYQVNDYQVAFEGEGNEGMVQIKPFKSLFDNWTQFNPDDIIIRLLRYFDYKVEKQNNPAFSINLIAEKNNVKFGVDIIKTQKGNVSDKAMSSVLEHSKLLGCDNVMVFFLEGGMIPSQVTNFLKSNNGQIFDLEDLMRISSVIDNKGKLEEEGKFEQLYSNISLSKNPEDSKKIAMEMAQKEQLKKLESADEVKKDKPKEDLNADFFATFEKMLAPSTIEEKKTDDSLKTISEISDEDQLKKKV